MLAEKQKTREEVRMSKQFDKMVVVLKELFQLDQPDLDFGIYRIMHAKAEEITRFLEKDLLPQVKEAFSQYTTADKTELEKELKKAIEQANGLGVDPETTTKVKDLRRKIADESVDVDALENEVYDHLYSFFRRYYHEGDYLSKRVYKPGVYAIPYEGEEVKLHWANRDQYYIKTSEYLRDYAFTLRPGDAKNPMRVHFRLTDIAEGEHGNVKASNGKERVFILAAEDFIAEEDGELVLRFHYRPATMDDWPQEALKEATAAAAKKPPSQKELLADAVRRILAIADPALKRWIDELSRAHVKTNGETADYSRLQGHLNRYTARFTFDYFIHKDLGSFLRRELDFFIKNEVMHLDDVENESAARVDQYLSKIKVIRKIAHKLIDFLAQLEDFQKKLWLKRKFIVETNYCITLDRIPEEFYPEIAANEAQRQEWVQLFSIDEISGAAAEPAAYSIPLSIDFLRQNRHLPVDTRFFDDGFRSRLIGSFSSLDEITDDLLVHSDNFQALQLLHPRYGEQVKCIYIDPPYNTASSSIPYKNNYKHSSFASLMHGRIEALHSFLRRDGAIFVSIDKTERTVLQHVLDDIFGDDNRVEELIWSMNTNNSQAPNYSTNHEYVLVYAKDRPVAEQDKNMFREPKPGYEEVMELVGRLNPSYPPVAAIEAAIRDLYEKHKVEYREQVEAAGFEWEDEKGNDPWKGLFNYNRAEYRDADGNLLDEADAKTKGAKIWVWQEGDASMPATKQAASTQDPNHPNWRFYKPNHPVTGKPSPHPKSGWKFAYESGEDSPDRRSFVSLDRDGRIAWGEDENKVPRLKRMLHEVETNVGKSVFSDYSDGEKQTSAMFGRSGVFLAPKHADFVSRFIVHAGNHESIVLDCFGGSGSTAHAVIKLDREDRGKRKSVTVEVGEYFDTVLKPRVLKAIYSRDWRAGKPLLRDGISRCVKILRLESYEDALNNLDTRRTGVQQNLLDAPGVQSSDGLREQYLLRYMLDVETRGSQSLLNVAAFNDPTAYKLKVKLPGTDESREVNVDLLETFNYMIGLRAQHIAVPQTFQAAFRKDEEGRLRLDGRLRQDEAGPWWFRTADGVTPDGRKTLLIWRKLTGDAEQDNLVLDEWFTRQGYSTKDYEFDLIYVNGDNNLENLRQVDETWKVRLIEQDFYRLMFDVESV